MTTYQYNGLTLGYFLTREFKWEPIYDPTNTDMTKTRYTIRGRGILQNTSALYGSKDSAAVIAQVKSILETPRKPFTFTSGTTVLCNVQGMAALPAGVALDANLGPHPEPAIVSQVINGGTFMVEVGMIIEIVDCVTNCPDGFNPVLSLRWTQKESFDQMWYSTLVTDGRLIVRSDLLQSADNFRGIATPVLLNDYQRMKSEYTLSPDGLELGFHFEDREADRLPPFPALKASGNFTVVVAKPGTQRRGVCEVSLEGPKGTLRMELLIRAIRMCDSKITEEITLSGDIGLKKNTPRLMHGSFREDLFNPAVHVIMESQLPPLLGKGVIGTPGRATVFPSCGTLTNGLHTNKPGISTPDRKRLKGLLTAAFSDPCLCNIVTELSTTGEIDKIGTPAIVNPNPNYPVPTITIQGDVIFGSGGTSGEVVNDSAPYNTYRIESEFSFDTGLRQLPSTGVQGDATQNVSSIVQVSGQVMTLTVIWDISRTGEPPVLPSFQSTDPNIVALKSIVMMQGDDPSADNQLTEYYVTGVSYYAVLDPSKARVVPAIPPYLSNSFSAASSKAAAFASNNILWSIAGSQSASNPNYFTGNGVGVGSSPVGTSANISASTTGTSENQSYYGLGQGGGIFGSAGGVVIGGSPKLLG